MRVSLQHWSSESHHRGQSIKLLLRTVNFLREAICVSCKESGGGGGGGSGRAAKAGKKSSKSDGAVGANRPSVTTPAKVLGLPLKNGFACLASAAYSVGDMTAALLYLHLDEHNNSQSGAGRQPDEGGDASAMDGVLDGRGGAGTRGAQNNHLPVLPPAVSC